MKVTSHSIFTSSTRSTPAGKLVGAVDQKQAITVTVFLRSKAKPGALNRKLKQVARGTARPLTRKQFAKQFGATKTDVNAVQRSFAQYGISVSGFDLGKRTVNLTGTADQFKQATNAELKKYAHPDGYEYRGREGALHLPRELKGIVLALTGLDERAQADTKHRVHVVMGETLDDVNARPGSLWPTDVAKLYDFPTNTQGEGQTIAILELGGGFVKEDIAVYLRKLGLDEKLADNVIFKSVDGAQNEPGDPNGADGEVMLDICIALAVAPKARIVVYFAPNTDQGFLNCILAAAHDDEYKPSIISISWGGPENSWTEQSFTSYNEAFKAAGVMGVTSFCAAGDDGSSDRVNDGDAHCDYPASSPYVVGCGGTNLKGSGSSITSETVWNGGLRGGATGGGISDAFPVPDYQRRTKIPVSANKDHRAGRGVPDVAGNADPATGFIVIVDGKWMVIGGTSAVAPLYAGLFALVNALVKRPVGYFNPFLYERAPIDGFCRDITVGNNGAYKAGPGWDACTGFGSLNGTKLVASLGARHGLKKVRKAA